MKKKLSRSFVLLVLLVLIISKALFSQSSTSNSLSSKDITLGNLVQLISYSNWESANTFLLNNGWEYENSTKGDNNSLDKIAWSFKKISKDRAVCWFYLYAVDGVPNKISYSFVDLKKFNLIKNNLASYGFSFKNSSVDEGSLLSTYQNNVYILTTTTTKEQDEDYSAYIIEVVKIGGEYDVNNGYKKEYYSNDTIKTTYNLKDGKVNGMLKRYSITGKLSSIEPYVNGTLNGVYKEYFEDGGLHYELEFKNDVQNGFYKEYYSTGNLAVLGYYKNDIEDGLWEKYVYNDKGEREVYQYSTFIDGVKNGKIKHYISDTIIDGDTIKNGYYEANFSKGSLDGDFKLYSSIPTWNGSSFEGGELSSLDREGKFINGKKEGLWKYYLFGTLLKEGLYENDLKTGIWKTFGVLGLVDTSATDTNKIRSTEEYKFGKLNGKMIEYFTYEKVPLPIDDTTSVKESYAFKKILEKTTVNYVNDKREGDYEETYPDGKIKTKCGFKNDKLHGSLIKWDSLGNVVKRGKFVNGRADSIWFFKLDNEGCKYISYLNGVKSGAMQERDSNDNLLVSGNYVNDLEDGKWTFYENNDITKIENYSVGKLNGELSYFEKGELTDKILFNDDEVLKIFNYLNNRLIEERDLLKKEKTSDINWYNYFVSVIKQKDGDTIEIQDYKVYSSGFPTDSIIKSNGIKEGSYYLKYNDTPVIEGTYQNGTKDGFWTSYFANNIVRNGHYSNGNYTSEYYTTTNLIDKKQNPKYSGVLNIYYYKNVIKERIAIKDGYRNGWTKYFDVNGKKIKEEKYKDGIIVK